MNLCKALARTSLFYLNFESVSCNHNFPISGISLFRPRASTSLSLDQGFGRNRRKIQSLSHASASEAVAIESTSTRSDVEPIDLHPSEDSTKDTIEQLLSSQRIDDVSRLMKMERKSAEKRGYPGDSNPSRWFPYLDRFRTGNTFLSSLEVLEALDPHILDVRKDRFRSVIEHRSYSVCLVVEGLSDLGNVSAAFRSADALGFQSVHVVSCDSSKRYRENRHVSMGAEKWLDIELWNSTNECFDILKLRGYQIATAYLGTDAVSVFDMDWSCPTAIVVGNENRGVSDEALQQSDLRCSIPMRGMVDSFNVSVAAGILMHHAVCDRTLRLGSHGDLTPEESQILLAEFSLRHSKSAISIAHEYAKRKVTRPVSRL
ncbi:hypothetical protein Nepgr_032060 [Nepenthes gracilis]|uniref:tRNA/rRNA methyltransferase SpoU type domain-containing protein n=1 Tax=Nepenthes gracilis TaxID=150966 RepID=A0AAD3TIR4_NEPGR|nr:hypothetical protein Nepgr_032060 [Nepenthes gracilis]